MRGSDWVANARAWIAWVGHDPHREAFLDSAVTTALGRVRGRRWLDAGCGEGRLSRWLAQRGATVLGVDASAPLVAAARRRSPAAFRKRLRYEVSDLAAPGLVPRGALDGVLCMLALQHVARPARVLKAWARALKPGGRVLVVLPHPCFMAPGTTWEATLPAVPRGRPQIGALRVPSYPARGRTVFRFDPAFPAATVNHHFSLETLSLALRTSGFLTARLLEPRPPSRLVARDPAWEPYGRVPFFLLWEAVRAPL
ncbi:MAG: class I SAM-dependent methyltransferase [Candidatus Eiseniibacteriota bacterium]